MKWTVLAAVGLMLLLFLWGVGTSLASLGSWDDAADARTVAAELTGPMIGFICRVGLAHLVLGLVSGVVAALLARWAFARRGAVGSVLCLALVLLYVFGRDLVLRPVFYEPHLYQPGGIPRALMVLATDHLSPRALDVAALAVLAVLLLAGAVRRRGRARNSHPLEWLRAGAVLAAFACLVLGGLRLVEPAARSTLAPASEAARPGSAINLVFLGADSLRPDRLRALGCPRDVLPNIDALAERAVVFRNAFVPLARTAPSLVSLFTGADPHSHGIRHMFPPRHRRTVRLPTLPVVLAGHGYRSEVVTDYAGDVFNQIELGFDAVYGPPALNLLSLAQYEIVRRTPAFLPVFNHPWGHALFPVLRTLPANADPDWLADRLLDRLDALDRAGRPFCLAAFFTGPHTPYAARFPGYRRYADPGYQGPNKYAYFVRSLEELARLEQPLPEAEVAQIRALYDGACHLTDAAIGRVIAEIRRRGLWSRTLIIVFSDHGESLYEPRNTSDHGKWFRGDEANRFPLVIAGGPVEELHRTVDDLVRMTDVFPTLLRLLGMDIPPTVDGVDLLPRMRGEAAAPLPVFAETGVWLDAPTTFEHDQEALLYPPVDRLLIPDDEGVLVLREAYHSVVEEAKHRCLRTDRWKLVYIPTKHGVRYELYDVQQDPANLHDLAELEPWRVWSMSRRLRRWMLGDPGKRFDERGHLVPTYGYFE